MPLPVGRGPKPDAAKFLCRTLVDRCAHGNIFGASQISPCVSVQLLMQAMPQPNLLSEFFVSRKNLSLPSILENPINSRLWQCPAVCTVRSLRDAESITLDQCRFGTPWRKRTRMLLLHCCSVHCLDRRCAGRKGLCSTTGRHHIILQGSGPGGKTWTSRAQTFPKKLADELGRILSSTAEQQAAQNLRSFVA